MKKIEVIQGDITKLEVDVIVNAANHMLLPGGGVCGAIHRAAGPKLAIECRTIGGCETGNAIITKAYNLRAKSVVHAVGPVFDDDPKIASELLASCYLRSMELASKSGYKSIAFPCISTGIFGYPKEPAAKVALEAVTIFPESSLERVVFCCFEEVDFRIYNEILG